MNLIRLLLLLGYTMCFTSFLWAMLGGFFRTVEAPPTGLRRIQIFSSMFITLHLVALFISDTQIPARQLLGVAMYAVSLGLFWLTLYTHKGIRLSHAFSDDCPLHLVTHGPYRLVRHPFYASYLAAWLAGCIGITLFLLPTFIVMYNLYRSAALQEERKYSRSILAAQYEKYRLTTTMFFPRLGYRTPWRHNKL